MEHWPRRSRTRDSGAPSLRGGKRIRSAAHENARPLTWLICWRLDRLGRNLRHFVTLLEDQSLGVAFVLLGEEIDCTTPAGKLQLHILAALAEFERERIRERVIAALQRAEAQEDRPLVTSITSINA